MQAISKQYCRLQRKAALWACIVVLFGFTGKAFAQRFNFRALPDGPIADCYKVIQDKKGFIWISTEKGLYRYDGKTYRHFTKATNGEPFFSVFQLAETKTGNVLFNTLDSRIGCVHNDSVYFLPLSSKLQAITHQGNFQVIEMYEDEGGILWIGTGIGLYRTKKANDYSDLEFVTEPCSFSSNAFAVHVIEKRKALSYIANIQTQNNYAGKRLIYNFVCNNNGSVVKGSYSIKGTSMQPAYLKSVLLKNGNVLLCVENRLEIIHPDGSVVEKIMPGSMLNLYEDKTGGLWICYWKKGVAYYADASLDKGPVWSLTGQDASSIVEDAEGGFWVSTLSGGVFYLGSKYVVDYSHINGMGINAKSVFTYNNKVLVNNENDYLTVLENDSVKQVPINSDYSTYVVYDYGIKGRNIYLAATEGLTSDTSLQKKWVRVIKEDGGSHEAYGVSISPDNKMYSINYYGILQIKNDTANTLCNIPARGHCICAVENGEVLVGTSKGVYSYKQGKITYFDTVHKALQGAINVIKEDGKNNIWIGTAAGGIVVLKNHEIVTSYTLQHGLASDYVSDVAFDEMGNTWVATDNGLSKIPAGPEKDIENYGTRNGLITADIIKMSISRRQQLWVATKLGINRVDIEHLEKNAVPPPVYISYIFVNDSLSFNTHDFLYRNNNLKFQLAGLTYKDNKTQFLYRLMGLDTVWHTSANAEIAYNNLPPGKYNFQAKAINAEGVSSVQAASFGFKIELPFWLRWWFIVCMVLLVGALVYLFIRVRLKAIQAKEAEKSRINKMIAEYQMTALSAQMNPHFVFNAINSIQDYILGNDTQKAYDYLTKFAQLVRVVLDNAKEKAITLEKELESLTRYVQLEQLRFHDTFDFKLNVAKDVDTFAIEVPAMIIQPYVENAIWHGLMPLGSQRKGVLKIDIKQTGTLLQIIVEDNGIGRELSGKIRKSTAHKSVGMQITQRRIEVLNNLLGAKGSEINIYDLYQNQVEPAGTRVEIKIVVNFD